jgi:threonine/homoserine/homoserine lactone efflux protein
VQQVIGNAMPLALGIAISPIPVIALILILITPKARSNGLAFLVGWMAGLFVIGGAALLVAGASGLTESTDTASQTSIILNFVLGALLLLLAFRQWRSKPSPGEDAPLPKWMGFLDAFKPGKCLLVGALLSGVNPKNLALNLAAMSVIAGAGLPRPTRRSR